MKPTFNRLQNQNPFLRGMYQKGTKKVFSLRVFSTQLQLPTFLSLSLAHFFNDQIWSPGKQFKRFPLAHTGFQIRMQFFSGLLKICLVSPFHYRDTEWLMLIRPLEHQLQQIAQGCIQGFEYLQIQRHQNISGQPASASGHLNRSVFISLNRIHPTFQAVTITSCLVTGHHWAVCVLYSSCQVLTHMDKSSLNISPPCWAAPALSAFPFCNRCFGSFWKGSTSEVLIEGSVLNYILWGAKTVSE